MKTFIISLLLVMCVGNSLGMELRSLTSDEEDSLNIVVTDAKDNETILDVFIGIKEKTKLGKDGYEIRFQVRASEMPLVRQVLEKKFGDVKKNLRSEPFAGEGPIKLWELLRYLSTYSLLELRVSKENAKILVFVTNEEINEVGK